MKFENKNTRDSRQEPSVPAAGEACCVGWVGPGWSFCARVELARYGVSTHGTSLRQHTVQLSEETFLLVQRVA